jgi:hypothetical protein
MDQTFVVVKKKIVVVGLEDYDLLILLLVLPVLLV